jgi:hemoglobin-like flavoprotein
MAASYDSDRAERLPPTAVVAIATAEEIGQIRDSFDAMGLARRKVAEAFYQRFFQLVPEARSMFPQNMERLHLKLMDTIAALVGALDNPVMFQSIIDQIGRQHARFGVTPSHLTAFGDALLWTWERHFGSAFTPEVREAWTTLYEAVRSDMLRAIEADRCQRP